MVLNYHHRSIDAVGIHFSLFLFFFFFFFFGAAPATFGDSQARGLIGAVPAGLHHSHSNAGSKLSVQPQLTATPDP